MTEKILNILTTYKSSINIRDDYLDTEKLNSFIPTSHNVELLEEYFEVVLNRQQKSILLSGAYGTGKSYLISILIGLLAGKFNSNKIDVLLKKIELFSPHFTNKLKAERNKKYLIVFPKDVFKDFKQGISLGIKEAIKENNIELEDSSIHKAMKNKIQDWEVNHKIFFQTLKKCLKGKNICIKNFYQQIDEFSPQAFKIFEDLYPKVMGGERFFPENAISTVPELLDAFEKAALNKKYDGVLYDQKIVQMFVA